MATTVITEKDTRSLNYSIIHIQNARYQFVKNKNHTYITPKCPIIVANCNAAQNNSKDTFLRQIEDIVSQLFIVTHKIVKTD